MKISELLRQLLDVISAAEQEQEVNHAIQPNNAELEKVDVDTSDHTDGAAMIPPLQQKLELLKKSNNIDSYYDNDCDDELNDIKKNAGIAFITGEDNDIGD